MSLYRSFKWPVIELACNRQRNVHILVSKYEIEREARHKEQKLQHKAQEKEAENRMKQMRKMAKYSHQQWHQESSLLWSATGYQ